MNHLGAGSRKIVAAVALVALVPFLLLFRLEAQTQYRGKLRDEDIYYTPAPSVIPLLSLGYRRAFADVMWLQALQYFGQQLSRRGQMPYLLQRADAILAADPYFRDVYSWVAVAVVYNSTQITFDDIESSNRYLERGMRRFPRDGELRYMLAFNYAIELPSWTDDVEKKRRWRRRAAALFAEAAELPGAPADAALMAVEMGKKGGDKALAIAYTRRLLAREPDDAVRDQLLERLAFLTSRDEAERADRERRRLMEAWQRDWPYLPPGLFAIVGERFRDSGRADPGTDAGDEDEMQNRDEADVGAP